MKVAVDARSLVAPMSGTGVTLLETLRALRALDPSDEYLLLATRPLDSPVLDLGASVHLAPWVFRRAGSLYFRYGLRRSWAGIDPAVHWATLQVGPGRRPRGKPVLLQMHDLVFRRFPETMSRKNALISRMWVEKSLAEADLVYCVSEYTRREILEWRGGDERRIRTVPNGVSAVFHLAPEQFDADQFRQQHRLPERYVLFVGTLEPRKNLSLLLDALPHTPAFRDGDVKLLVIGGAGWRNLEIERRLDREIAKGRAVRLGYVSPADLPGYYGAAELFVLPSDYEGFGLPVLEAMAAGAPVLSSNAASLPEVGGTAAAYFEAGELDALVSRLQDLLDAPEQRARMRFQGRLRAREFSWDRTASGVRSLLEELA